MGRRGQGRGGMRRGGRMRAQALLELFRDGDANGDGGLSAEEIAAYRATLFGEIDADGSGTINAEEFAAHLMRMRAQRFIARRDRDGDGELSLEEAPAPGERLMRFDLDENGVVTRNELRIAAPRLARRLERMERRGAPQAGEGEVETDAEGEVEEQAVE